MRTRTVQRVKRGFTLIEILIVVVILGILAAIVIPQFTDASQQASASSVKSTLQTVRSQIELFRVKYGGAVPADLGELVEPPDLDGNPVEPFLQREPVAPTGFAYVYNAGELTAECTASNPDCPDDIADW